MAEYLFQEGKLDNAVHDITYKQIEQLYLDNRHEEHEGKRITESSYRGENYYGNYNNLYSAMQQEYLLRDPKTAGMRIYYPHGVVIEQSMRRNYYRGENQIYKESTPTLHRLLKKFSSKKEQELYRMVADIRVAEFPCDQRAVLQIIYGDHREMCSGEIEGYIAVHSIPNLWYILRKIWGEMRRK